MPGSYVGLGIKTLEEVESIWCDTAQNQGFVFDRQLKYTKGVLKSVPKEHLVEQGNVHRELYRVIAATKALLNSGTAWSIKTHEGFMENLFDLQWWTCVVALQVGKGQLLDRQTYLSLQVQLEELAATQLRDVDYILKKEPHAGVTNLARREIPWSRQRHLPSYHLQALLIQREGSYTRRLMFPWDKHPAAATSWIPAHVNPESSNMSYEACLPDTKHRVVSEDGIKSVCDEKWELDLDMIVTEIRDRGDSVPHVGVFNVVEPVDIFRAKLRGSPTEDHITIDLFQDILGVSDKGWVIRTWYKETECAMKRLEVSTTEINDGTNVKPPDLARLWHPHIVDLVDYWTEESYLFLVMELMDGDLAELIANKSRTGSDKTKSPFTLVEAVDIMLQIAKGMVYMHDMGVAHPHLKCASVLLRADTTRNLNQIDQYYVVKLGGFGNSMKCDLEDQSRDVYLFGLTCLDILTGNVQSEDSIQHHIPESTPPTMRFCIENCLSAALTFSEVVILLLLTQLQMLEGKEEIHRNKSLAKSNISLGGKLFRTELPSIPITKS